MSEYVMMPVVGEPYSDEAQEFYKEIVYNEAKPIPKDSWISVKDKKPEPFKQVLTKCKHGLIEGHWDDNIFSFTGYYWMDMYWFASHWMPLPEPPKGEEKK